MSEISEEIKKAGQKAFENHEDYYTVDATGNTYPVKDDLQSWAFFWDAEKRMWINDCASEFEKFLFERHVIDGDWPGVVLNFTHNYPEKWEKQISKETK